MKNIIEFQNVSKAYRLGLTRTSIPALFSKTARRLLRGNYDKKSDREPFWALSDVSFDLKPGQSLALIGPNGAGKTTVLKLLARITRPTSGQIIVNGRLSALIELGAGFHPDLTGRENIYLNGIILGLNRREIDERFDEIVDFSELDQFIDTPIKRYSSGMVVRLGFSVAACIEPDFLLVDEVLAVGDASFRQKCIERIKVLLNDGTSLVFVSHNLGLVKAICENAIYMEHGTAELGGKTAEVIDAYNQALDRQRFQKMERAHSISVEYGHDVEITGISVLANNSQPNVELYSDQPAEIIVHYTAYSIIERANFLLRIYRADGLSCCIMRTSLDNFHTSIQKGKGAISVNIEPLQLYGGTYYVIVWVMNSDDSDGIARGTSDFFQVKNPTPGREAQDAIFEPNRKWRQHYYSAEKNSDDDRIAG